VIVTPAIFEDAIRTLSRYDVFGFDTETTGFTQEDRLFSIILATVDDVYYFDFNNTLQESTLSRDLISSMSGFFGRVGSTYYVSDAKFDTKMLLKEGINIKGRLYCTQIGGRILHNDYGHEKLYGLNTSLKRHFGIEKSDLAMNYLKENNVYTPVDVPGKKAKHKNYHFDRIPLETVAPYAEEDAKQHLMLGVDIEKQMPESSREVVENDMKLIKAAAWMEHRGIKVDAEYTNRAKGYETDRYLAAKGEFFVLTGQEFVDSSKCLQPIFDKEGLKYGRTPTGRASFTSDSISSNDHSIPKSILSIRNYEKRIGTYYSSFIHYADRNSIIHPNMRIGGTGTGRVSYWNPNLQNVPKEEHSEEEFLVRSCFVPDDSDQCFVFIDFEQQEFKVMADYSGDKKLIREINNGEDIHSTVAKITGLARSAAKTLNFALLYGMGIDQLAHSLGTSAARAREVRKLYFERLPRIEDFICKVQGVGKRRGYVHNWLGRRMYMDNPKFAYKLPNHIVQGGCADIIKVAMNRIHDYCVEHRLRSHMKVQVHDEVLFGFYREEFEHIPVIRKIMEDAYKPMNGIKLTCSVEHSWKSWGIRDKTKGVPDV